MNESIPCCTVNKIMAIAEVFPQNNSRKFRYAIGLAFRFIVYVIVKFAHFKKVM